MLTGARHSKVARLLAVAMSLVVVLASIMAMACHVGGSRAGHVAAAATAHTHDDHAHARPAHTEHTHVGYAHHGISHEVATATCDSDADHCPAQPTHFCVCDFACHSGWSFTETRAEPVGVVFARLSFDWSSQAMVGATLSTLDRPPKLSVHA